MDYNYVEDILREHESEVASLETDYGIISNYELDRVLNPQAKKNYTKALSRIYIRTGEKFKTLLHTLHLQEET